MQRPRLPPLVKTAISTLITLQSAFCYALSWPSKSRLI